MAKIKAKTKRIDNKKRSVMLASSIVALTAVGVGVYFFNAKSASASDRTLKNIGNDETQPSTSPTVQITRAQTTTTEPRVVEPEVTTTNVSYETSDVSSSTQEPTPEPTPVPTTRPPVNRNRLELSTQKALERAYSEYMKNVRDPKPGNMIDQNGNLYDCGYRKIGTFPQGVRIFTYLSEGVGENRQYYANFDETHSCGVNEYQWCGAFIAYCWADVKFEDRVRYFPGVTRMMEWINLNPARAVSDYEIKPGDILLIARDGATRGHHIALCYEVLGNGAFKTIEGNTYGDGQPEGVCYRTRHIASSPYRPAGKHFIIKALRPLETDLA